MTQSQPILMSGARADDVVAELDAIAAEREAGTADETNHALLVVARLSREDAALMRRAAKTIRAYREVVATLAARYPIDQLETRKDAQR